MQPGDKPNPFAALLHSRKVLLTMLDVALSIVGHFVGEYASPAAKSDILYLTIILQPVIIFLIKTITDEDTAATRANADIAVAAHQANAEIAVAQVSVQAAAPTPFLPGGAVENRTNAPMPDRPIARS